MLLASCGHSLGKGKTALICVANPVGLCDPSVQQIADSAEEREERWFWQYRTERWDLPPRGRTRPQLNSPLPTTPKPLKCFLLRRHVSPTRNAEEGERKEHKKGSVSRKNTLRRCFSPPLALCAALCLLSSAVNQLMLRRRALSFRGRR